MVSAPGYYVHQYNMTSGQLITPLYLILIYGCAYSATLPLLKTSILLDWCQIFVPAGRSKNFFWWGCAAIIFIQVTSGIVVTTLLNMQCVPHAAIWKFYLPSKCYVVSDVMLGSASVQVLSDWSMVLLPHKVIWSLHMDWQKKVGISIIFMAGILLVYDFHREMLANVIRASVSASVRLSTTITFAKETDQMYYIGPLLFWACAEMTCGFFILCVPCFPSIIKHFGLQSKVKEFFGISTKASDPSTSSSATYGQSGNSKGKWGRRKVRAELESADPYYKMDETKTLSLEKLTPTRSQDPEHGWEGEGEGGGVHVTRTTDVSSITDPESAQTSNTLKNQQILPWAQ